MWELNYPLKSITVGHVCTRSIKHIFVTVQLESILHIISIFCSVIVKYARLLLLQRSEHWGRGETRMSLNKSCRQSSISWATETTRSKLLHRRFAFIRVSVRK